MSFGEFFIHHSVATYSKKDLCVVGVLRFRFTVYVVLSKFMQVMTMCESIFNERSPLAKTLIYISLIKIIKII